MAHGAHVSPSIGSGAQPVRVSCFECNYSEESLPTTWNLCELCVTQFDEAQLQGEQHVPHPVAPTTQPSEDPTVRHPTVPGTLSANEHGDLLSQVVYSL